MFKPDLYQKSNSDTKRDALDCLQKYGSIVKWGIGDSVIDLGCGDGSVTVEVLKKFLPRDFARLVGCDIAEQMVGYANQKYGDERTYFTVLDVGAEVPHHLQATFHHAFSFYALHWIQDQEKAFENIYKLLADGGDCLLQFVCSTPIQDFYRILAKHPRWQNWLTDVEKYISPYRDVENPENRVRGIMAKVGFKNIRVELEEKQNLYEIGHYRNTMEAICPFKIPAELTDQFMDDYMKVVRDMNLVRQIDGESFVQTQYSLLVAYGNK